MHWETVSRDRPTKHGFKSATNRQIRLAERAHYRPSFFPKKEERTYSSASRRFSNKASAVHLLLYVAEKRRSTARQARPAPLADWMPEMESSMARHSSARKFIAARPFRYGSGFGFVQTTSSRVIILWKKPDSLARGRMREASACEAEVTSPN